MGTLSKTVLGSILIYIAIMGFNIPGVTLALTGGGVDLSIWTAGWRPTDSTNKTYEFSVTVKNQGANDSSNFEVVLQVDMVHVKQYSIPSLQAGQNLDCLPTAIVPLTAGDHNITIIVDSMNQVNETDEANNVLEFQMTVVQDQGGPTPNIPNWNFTLPDITNPIIQEIVNYIVELLIIPAIIVAHPVMKGILFITGLYMLVTGLLTIGLKRKKTEEL
jgi:hypothetical protein